MLSDSSIADVGETLISLLRNEMEDIEPEQVALLSPVDVSGQDIRVTVFLYSVVETPSLRNESFSNVTSNLSLKAPISLDLYYMLTCYGSESIENLTERTLQARRYLGQLMRIFYDIAIISGTQLQGDLAGTDQELKITLNTITVEDITRIWSVFPDTSYQTSVSYLVTPVRLASKLSRSEQRVVSSQVESGNMVADTGSGG